MVMGPTGVGKVKSSRARRAFSESMDPAFLIAFKRAWMLIYPLRAAKLG
jgi:hypothetical protein